MDAGERKQMQKDNLLALAEDDGFKFTDSFFPYTSGQIGPYYVQSANIMSHGSHYLKAIKDLMRVIEDDIGERNFNVVSGGERRDYIFSFPVAAGFGKPHAMLFKDPKTDPMLGASVKDKRVVHVADLQNEGSSIEKQWYPQIKEAEGNLVYAFFFVDRLEDGVEAMKRLNVPSDAVIKLNADAWQALLDEGRVNPLQYKSLCERSEIGKDAWAHKMLRERVDVLEELLRNPATENKGCKILELGYPELKDELADMLKQRGFDYNA